MKEFIDVIKGITIILTAVVLGLPAIACIAKLAVLLFFWVVG